MCPVKYAGKSPNFIHPKHLFGDARTRLVSGAPAAGRRRLGQRLCNGAHTVNAAGRVRRVVGMDYDLVQLKVARPTARRVGLDRRLSRWKREAAVRGSPVRALDSEWP